jgi:hypothetical protein
MAKISETILTSNPQAEGIDQAISWAQKGLDVVITTRQSNKLNDECEVAYISMLFNVALMRRVSGFFCIVSFFFWFDAINCFCLVLRRR